MVRTSALLVATVSGFTLAQAASVESLSGTLRINRGAGFVASSGTDEVKPGDALMVDLKGSARVVYRDGCSVSVLPGAVVTVAEVSPCSLLAQAGVEGTAEVSAAGGAAVPTGALIAAGLAAAAAGGNLAVRSASSNASERDRQGAAALLYLAQQRRPVSP